MKTVGIILGSGMGQRFKATIPKQFVMLNNKMIIQYPIDALRKADIDYIICTLPPNYSNIKHLEKITEIIQGVDKFVIGANERNQTVMKALEACPPDTTYVVFIDAVRPFVNHSLIKDGLIEIQKDPEIKYVLTGQRITDSLFSIHPHSSDNSVIRGEDRDKFRLSISPEIIEYQTIYSIYQNKEFIKIVNPEFTPKVFNFYPQFKGKFIDYNGTNLKITYEEDVRIAEQLLKQTKSESV